MVSIEQACYWFSTVDAEPPGQNNGAVSGNLRAQIVIVGGGFTGLWAAYFLKQLDPSADVVVVEQSVVGYGGSGRNAGIISASIDHSHALAIAHFGLSEAKKMVAIGKSNLEELEQFAVDCDYEPNGAIYPALTQAHVDSCRELLDAAERLGISGYKVLSAQEVQAQLNSPLYRGGVFAPGGGIINPLKLVKKIKTKCLEAGVRVFEHSPVRSLEDSAVICDGGRIDADKIVLATDAYTHHLFPQLLHRFIPLYDYILVSEPLSLEQLDSIGWKNRQGFVDQRVFFNYYRLTADNRILWGTSEAMYYAPNKVDPSCDHSQSHYTSLRLSFKRHFPQLANLEFPYAWGGPIASTTRLTPFFGTAKQGRLLYGLGYTGHGIGSTRVGGKILAHMALLKDSDVLSLKLAQQPPFPYPPEPLRSLSVDWVTKSLRQVDEGKNPNLILRLLDALGIGFSS